jgi:hypothetical protein
VNLCQCQGIGVSLVGKDAGRGVRHGRGVSIEVLTLSEMLVPAMIIAAAPIIAGDQIVVLLGNYRGDIWMMNLQEQNS